MATWAHLGELMKRQNKELVDHAPAGMKVRMDVTLTVENGGHAESKRYVNGEEERLGKPITISLMEALLFERGELPRERLTPTGGCVHCGAWRGGRPDERHDHDDECPVLLEHDRLKALSDALAALGYNLDSPAMEAAARLQGNAPEPGQG